MKKYFAMLAYRVARWLAPEYFANRLQSLTEIRMRIGVLRARVCELPTKKLHGPEGRLLIAELQSLESIYKSVESYGDRYELLKIEVAMTKMPRGLKSREEWYADNKRRMFEAVAAGLSQSAEIEKFMYTRLQGKIDVMGIELHLKHKDPKMTVGNYTKHNDK